MGIGAKAVCVDQHIKIVAGIGPGRAQSQKSIYPTVTIGSQVWMTENLSVTHYRDGTPIKNIQDGADFAADTTGAYGVYGGDPMNNLIYGKLYNWYAVDNSAGLAPDGWHIPTEAEWTALTDELADGNNEGAMLAGSSHLWSDLSSATLKNNSKFGESGLNIVPSGRRFYINGAFLGISTGFDGWGADSLSSTTAFWCGINWTGTPDDLNVGFTNKSAGNAVRCIKD